MPSRTTRLLDGKFSRGFEALTALTRCSDFTMDLVDAILAKGGAERAIRAMKKEFFQPQAKNEPKKRKQPLANTIFVYDIPATELTAETERECNLTYLDRDYRAWDYYTGRDGNPISGRGKRFVYEIWTPGRYVSSSEVREYFKAKGMIGHTGAFTALVKEGKLTGYHASIPDDNGCWRHPGGAVLFAPYSIFDGAGRGLFRGGLDGDWNGFWSFVGFRKL